MFGAVNVGSSGILSTASIDQRTGNIVIGEMITISLALRVILIFPAQTDQRHRVLLTLLVLIFIMEEPLMLTARMGERFQPKQRNDCSRWLYSC